MFLIASTGRCGTMALCTGLNACSDHTVAHEPEPRLLDEAYRKHIGQSWHTTDYIQQMKFFRQHQDISYGQSIRAPNLLENIRTVAPETAVLIIVRNPIEYVLSAHAKRVFTKYNEWDRTRIVPLGVDLQSCSLAEKIALHWLEINRYLLDFAERDYKTKVVTLDRLDDEAHEWVRFLGVSVANHKDLKTILGSRVNASSYNQAPDGFDPALLLWHCESNWARAKSMSSTYASTENSA